MEHGNRDLQGLARIIVYSYMSNVELMRKIRSLSKKDRDRVDSSHIIRESRGSFSARVELTEALWTRKISIRSYDYITLTCEQKLLIGPDRVSYCKLLSCLASRLIVAEGRKTKVFLKLILSSTNSEETMTLDCADEGQLTMVGLYLCTERGA